MSVMVRYNEDFLIRRCTKISIDHRLPFKLQKKKLLKKLGFPLENSCFVSMRDPSKIESRLASYLKKPRILVTIYLKPMSTCVLPVFIVERGRVEYRDEYNKVTPITPDELLKRLRGFPVQTWVGFTDLTWMTQPEFFTGRLIYFSYNHQILEIQQNVRPDEIGQKKDVFPYFNVELCFFEPIDKLECCHLLIQTGFPGLIERRIRELLGNYLQQFETLRQIASLPALEFGYTTEIGLAVIDIDWPDQYIY